MNAEFLFCYLDKWIVGDEDCWYICYGETLGQGGSCNYCNDGRDDNQGYCCRRNDMNNAEDGILNGDCPQSAIDSIPWGTHGHKCVRLTDLTKEDAVDICSAVGGNLILDTSFSKYAIPGRVLCSNHKFSTSSDNM